MHHPTWISRKFSFQLAILLTTVVTSHASALRARRETNVGVSPSGGHLPYATTTPGSSKIVTESNFISMETTEPEELTAVGDSEIAMDVDTQSLPNLDEATIGRDVEASMPMLSQSQIAMNANDSSTTTSKYADVTLQTTASSPMSAKVAVITTTPEEIATTTIVAALAPKPTSEDNLAEKLDVITTTIRAEITEKPSTAVRDESQSVTARSKETEANITTENAIDLKTTTMLFAETTQESAIFMDKNREYSTMPQDTTIAALLQDTTIAAESFDDASTLVNSEFISNDPLTTTASVFANSEMETTTISRVFNDDDITTTETIIETNKSTKEIEVDKANYDVTINEIKKNQTTVENGVSEGHKEVQGKLIDEEKQQIEHIIPVTTSPTATTGDISSTSLKMKTTKSHKFIENPDIIRTNDIDSIPVTNHTFTSTGAAANSIENTLEAGQVDDSVLNKLESRAILPQIIETKQAMKMMNSTPTVVDLLLPSTPSIEKNRVEEVDDFSLSTGTTGIPGYDASRPLTTTENVQSSLPSSIVPVASPENRTSIYSVDTTTRRIERSTSEPATLNSTTQNIMKSTTIANASPLSAMPIERELESTTAASSANAAANETQTTTMNHNVVASDNSETKQTTEPDISTSTLPNVLVSEPMADLENGESNTILTSTMAFNTIRIATTLPSTTPMQNAKQPPTKARLKPTVAKEATPTMNTTHLLSTEPIEEYTIQPRTNHSLDFIDAQTIAATASPTTITTDFPGSESTEKVTTTEPNGGPDYNVIIAISVSVVGIVALILLVGFLYVMRKRQKSISYGQRCRPVSLDAYSLDNVSIFNSVRRKGASRASKRSYGNAAFDDPSLKHNTMGIHELAKFVERRMAIHEEFRDVPQINSRPDEVPIGCEDKNRYANVIPLPETRVILNRIGDDDKSEYINANYVRGPKDPANYYIACQAPLESTIADFWRMIWEQNSRVIIMATDLIENGAEKCAEYIPASMTLDNYVVYGDFQIVLKSREVKDKYAVSTIHVKNIPLNRWREITHFWYRWPETGVPTDEASVIAMLLEARSYLKMGTPEQSEEEIEKLNFHANGSTGSLDKTRSLSKTQGPLTVHCSPGTGRTGTIVTCDIALRSLEMPKRTIDIPQFVYYVRRGRASAVQTKEQYEFIYKVAHMYATKISGPINDN